MTTPARLTQCPKDYQDRIINAGGFNKYGQPNFKLVWGEAHTTRAAGGNGQYVDLHLNDVPCWLLLEWHAPEEYGSPTLWYINNYEEETGLHTLGEFPYKGRYEVLFVLRDEYMDGNQLVVEAMPLNAMLIDVIIPLMQAGKHISHERRAAAIKARREREEEEQLRVMVDARLDAQLAFGGAAFRGRHGSNSGMVAKKEEILRRGMMMAYRQMKRAGMGVSVHGSGFRPA